MRISTLLISLLFSVGAIAQIENGYYRVKNQYTSRYLYLIDNKGGANIQAATADVGAIAAYKDTERYFHDPACVICIEQISGGYNLRAQGTSSYDIISMPLSARPQSNGTLRCYATHSSVGTRYLADTRSQTKIDMGLVEAVSLNDVTIKEMFNWHVLPITPNSDNYFGVKPTIQIGNKYYASFYASFPFSLVSAGMKAYKVVAKDKNKVVCEEIALEVIPAATPVVIECSSANPVDNKLDIVYKSVAALGGNLLKGNYFFYGPDYSDSHPHRNVTAYNASTMRVLGKMANGELGFVKSSRKYLEANSMYLPIDASITGDLQIEFQASGIDDVVFEEQQKPGDIYTVSGTLVKKSALTTDGLEPGVYIVNKKKVVVR